MQVPQNVKEAYYLDQKNGNQKFQNAMKLELQQLFEYDTFVDLGTKVKPPAGYSYCGVHFVFDIKHNFCHKAHLVADGHKTPTPIESVYSSVVSLHSLRIVMFLAELNSLQLFQADIGNAYLEAKTKEKLYFVAGKEFGELEGHTIIINKALYGLKTSGLRYHECFADTLWDMGFNPSKADADVWMKHNGNLWEYIAIYVDDLAIAAKDPQAIIN